MKSKKPSHQAGKKEDWQQQPVSETQKERNPELIEKFYKQIINSFGYAYAGKV